MRLLKVFLTFLLIVVFFFTANSQRSISLQDSITKVLVPFKYVVASNLAYTELKYYKKVEGLAQERLHSKDIVISYYERVYSKCRISDSLNQLVLQNKDEQLITAFQLYKEQKREVKLQKVKTWLLSTILPIITGGGGLLIGFYIPH